MMPLSIHRILVGCILMTVATATSCTGQVYVLNETDYVPFDQKEKWELTKDFNCSSNMEVTYLISTWRNGTHIVCACDDKIYGGYCAELNNGSELRIQANYAAPCHNFTRTPCKQSYNSSETFLIRECFEKFGNIASPRELFLQNKNLQRIESDQNKVIQEQNYSLSIQIIRNLKLMKKIHNQNMTIMDLTSELKEKRNLTEKQNMIIMELTKKLSENIQNKEHCENTVLDLAFYFLSSLVLVVILGSFLVFIIHKLIYRDVITFKEFYCQRWTLIKCLFLTSSEQKQSLSPIVSATSNQNFQETNSEQKREDGNNEDSPNVQISMNHENSQSNANEDTYSEKNVSTNGVEKKNELTHKTEEDTGDYFHVDGSIAEDEALLSGNMEHRDRNDVKPERGQSKGEKDVILEECTKINKSVSSTEQKSKVYSKDRKPKETIKRNIENMEAVDNAEERVFDTY